MGLALACVGLLPGLANARTQPALAHPALAQLSLAFAGIPPATPTTPEELLRAGDAALDVGDRDGAKVYFLRVVREFPSSPEAIDARRVLRAMALPAATPSVLPGTYPAPVPPNRDIVIRNEPYSLRTSERLRLTTWEKTDFAVTSFIYGASLGVSLGLATNSDATSAIVLGAVGYTVGAVVFLGAANPDRGDLPLALGIASYVPMTTLLVSTAAFPHASAKSQAVATAISSVLAVPIAVVAARNLDLDPGDTQLVRDAAFWGLVLSVTGTLALSDHYDGNGPSPRRIAGAGLVGLYGGLGLGLLAATHSEILARARARDDLGRLRGRDPGRPHRSLR